jgi:hypothetical protein
MSDSCTHPPKSLGRRILAAFAMAAPLGLVAPLALAANATSALDASSRCARLASTGDDHLVITTAHWSKAGPLPAAAGTNPDNEFFGNPRQYGIRITRSFGDE